MEHECSRRFAPQLWSDEFGPADALWLLKLVLRTDGRPARHGAA